MDEGENKVFKHLKWICNLSTVFLMIRGSSFSSNKCHFSSTNMSFAFEVMNFSSKQISSLKLNSFENISRKYLFRWRWKWRQTFYLRYFKNYCNRTSSETIWIVAFYTRCILRFGCSMSIAHIWESTNIFRDFLKVVSLS